MRRHESLSLGLLSLFALASCEGVSDHPDTGGVTLGEGRCGGVTVVSSDFQSSSVAVLGFDGTVLGKSVISSGSAEVGLSAALGGDVVVPTSPSESPSVVLIDRTPAAVVTWFDAREGKVAGQLSVLTDFPSNPQDYVAISQSKAYVSRYADNGSPQGVLDRGGDVLVVDPEHHTITASIDLHSLFADPTIQPHPNRMVLVGQTVYVLCAALSANFKENGDSMIVAIDARTDTIVDSLALTDSHGCLGLALSPDRSKLAVACPGDFAGTPFPKLDHSALVIVDRTAALRQLARLGASTFSDGPLGFSATFASDDKVLFTTIGTVDLSPPIPDRLIATSLDGIQHQIVIEELASPPQVQEPTLGEVRCEAACGACFAANAAKGVVQRFALEGDQLGEPTSISIDATTKLPPRYLGLIGSTDSR